MLLFASKPQIAEHWQATVKSLNTILPERPSGYTGIKSADDLTVELALRGAESETALRHNDRPVPVVPFLTGLRSGSQTYWLAWHETWRTPQQTSKTRKNNLQFRSSSLTVYVGEVGSAKTQALRAEWAGAEVQSGTNTVVFQGSGAAHPHWHLAGLYDPASLDMGAPQPIDDLGGQVEISETFAALDPRLQSLEPAWAGVHLAASAKWAEAEWPGPDGPHDMHAHAPGNCDQIRTWIVSCTRYLQAELRSQLTRSRT